MNQAKSLKRIQNELMDLEKSRQLLHESGIYFHYQEEDMKKVYIMIVGPRDTPYEDGFYFFEFQFSENYPLTPPKVKSMTQGQIYDEKDKMLKNVRFNPNLYTDGKVCLSMINTWDGPGWVPTNTIINVIVAIQALVLTENPLENEPGYDENRDINQPKYESYNESVRFANYKISILEMMKRPPSIFEVFQPVMEEHKMQKKEKWIQKMREYSEKNKVNEENRIIDMPCYRHRMKINYEELIQTLQE
jgi:ubiquitin-protein ligase